MFLIQVDIICSLFRSRRRSECQKSIMDIDEKKLFKTFSLQTDHFVNRLTRIQRTTDVSVLLPVALTKRKKDNMSEVG